jgi:predicted glycosyltransferase involved in capsule biosynthesis
MKTDLTDVTFLILIRQDSIERLENILSVTESFLRYFNTNIYVLEADQHCNGILKRLLNKRIRYQFVEDEDPVLYKTKYFNRMILETNSPFVAIWDVDIVVDKNNLEEALRLLRGKEADVVYPYNGKCLDVPPILRILYFKKKNIHLLYRHKDKMDLLHDQLLVGGAVIINRDKFIYAGMENEKHYGWGNDDFDRYYRFLALGYKVHRIDTCLFHLFHSRKNNSKFHLFQQGITKRALFETTGSSQEELLRLLHHTVEL